MVPKLLRELHESNGSLQDYLEETLLCIHEEFGESVGGFIEKWKEQMEQLIPYVENSPEQLDRAVSDLSLRMEFWESMKDLSSAVSRIQQQWKGSGMYVEMVCKLVRRLMEAGGEIKMVSEVVNGVNESVASESYRTSMEIRDLQLQSLGGDIEFYPWMLPELIRERETNKTGDDLAIQIFEEFLVRQDRLEQQLAKEE